MLCVSMMCVCVLFYFAIRRVLQIFISIFWALFYSGGRTKVVIYIFSVVVSDLGSHIYMCVLYMNAIWIFAIYL